ncbi:MAG: GTP-binding protein, partial [Blautia sp.]|nr:GTP-binding protein [Blautia sp.]
HDHDHDHDHDHHHDDHDHDHHHDHEEGHEHHHHYDENGVCSCGHHHHDHDHDADEIFQSWGRETVHKYTKEGLEQKLAALADESQYGLVLRAKGMLPAEDGTWIHFDMVPEETEVREGAPDFTGRLCVIGSKLNEENLARLFEL